VKERGRDLQHDCRVLLLKVRVSRLENLCRVENSVDIANGQLVEKTLIAVQGGVREVVVEQDALMLVVKSESLWSVYFILICAWRLGRFVVRNSCLLLLKEALKINHCLACDISKAI